MDGLKNEVKLTLNNLSEEEQQVIAERRLICAHCPFNSSNAVSNPNLNYKTERLDEHCIFCGCNLQIKTASLISRCGIEAYNKQHPESPMELRWEAYKKPNEDGKEK